MGCVGYRCADMAGLATGKSASSKMACCVVSMMHMHNGRISNTHSLLFPSINSDMKRFNATEGENWLEPVMMNYTRCGPECPQEGCF